MDKSKSYLNTPNCVGKKDAMIDVVCFAIIIPLGGLILKCAIELKSKLADDSPLFVSLINISLLSLTGQTPNLKIDGDTSTDGADTVPNKFKFNL